MANVIFKCYSELDAPENMLFVSGHQIKNISSKVGKDGRSKMIINYYDDELCFTTFLFVTKLKQLMLKMIKIMKYGNNINIYRNYIIFLTN